MYSLAFYVFLCVGKMAATNNNKSLLSNDNIATLVNAANHVSLKVTFLHYKHSYNQPLFSVIIRQCSFCPVQFMLNYLKLRGNSLGPLFTIGGLPVHRQYFCSLLTTAIKRCGLKPARYKGLNFSNRSCLSCGEGGMSDARIRVLGRWKSNAFLRYIQISSLSATN